MELSDIQRQSRRKLNLEIDLAMSAYIQQMLSPTDAVADVPKQIPLIGADARTGVAVRRWVPTDSFIAVQP